MIIAYDEGDRGDVFSVPETDKRRALDEMWERIDAALDRHRRGVLAEEMKRADAR